MPFKESDLYKRLKILILDLSQRFNTAAFEPHVTLLPGVEISEEEVISKTGELAGKINPYRITLDLVDYTDFFFQSFVIRALATNEVLEANKLAREVFGRHKDTLYVPHLSVMYVRDLDNQTKKHLTVEIEDRFKGLEFTAEDISIWQTSPNNIPGWKMIEKVKLNG